MTKPKINAKDEQLQKKYEAMLASTVLLDLTIHRFGDKRKTTLDDVLMKVHDTPTGDVEQVEVSDAAFQLSRRLLDLSVGRKLRSTLRKGKARIKRISVPSFDREGVYRLSFAAVEEAERILQETKQALEPLKAEFREVYDVEVQKMRAAQREKFRAKDYPSAWAAGERWGIEWTYLETASVPKALAGVNKFVYQRAISKAQARAKTTFAAIEQTLRAGLMACVQKMRDDLEATTPSGKPRAYRDDALAKVDQFFSTFPLRNIINDGVSVDAMKAMRAILKNVPTADALDDATLRAQVVKGLASVADTIRPYLSEQAERAIALPDDDE
jgi:hypothetical protein